MYLKHKNLKDLFLRRLRVFCLPLAVWWALLHTSHNPKCFCLVASTGVTALLLVIATCAEALQKSFPYAKRKERCGEQQE